MHVSIDPAVLDRLDEWSDYLVVGRGKLVEIALVRLLNHLDLVDPAPGTIPAVTVDA